MSHELRTPLSIRFSSSWLIIVLSRAKRIRSINRGGEHLLELINDVLSMSTIEARSNYHQWKPLQSPSLLNSLKRNGLRKPTQRLRLKLPTICRVRGKTKYNYWILINLLAMRLNLLNTRNRYFARQQPSRKKTPQQKTNLIVFWNFRHGPAFLLGNIHIIPSPSYKPKQVNPCRELVSSCRSANSLSGLWNWYCCWSQIDKGTAFRFDIDR